MRPPFTRTVWREVALPGCEGLYAYARGDFERAWHHLSVGGAAHGARPAAATRSAICSSKSCWMPRSGSGRLAVAQQMLELRRTADPDGVPVNTALAAVYRPTRLRRSLADQARSRARA